MSFLDCHASCTNQEKKQKHLPSKNAGASLFCQCNRCWQHYLLWSVYCLQFLSRSDNNHHQKTQSRSDWNLLRLIKWLWHVPLDLCMLLHSSLQSHIFFSTENQLIERTSEESYPKISSDFLPIFSYLCLLLLCFEAHILK